MTRATRGTLVMWLTLVGGAVALGLSVKEISSAGIETPALMLCAVTLIFSAIGTVSIPGAKINLTVSDGFILTAVILFGIPIAVLLAFCDAFIASLRVTKSNLKRGFNASSMAVSIMISSHIVAVIHPAFLTLHWQNTRASQIIFPLGLLGLFHYLINSSLISTVVALRTGRGIVKLWREDLLWTSISYFSGASVAGILYLLISVTGFYTFIIAVPIVMIIYFTYRTYLDKVENSRQQAIRLEELFAKVSKGKREWEVTFDTLTEAIFIFNEAGRLIRINSAAQQLESRLSGGVCLITEMPGRECSSLHLFSDQAARDNFIRAQAGQEINCELRVQDAAGEWLDLAFTANPVEFDIFQEQSPLLVVVRDITEQKRLREQLIQAEKMSAVGQLVAGVAHEINNPLTSVIGFSQLLEMSGQFDDAAGEDLKLIISEAERARAIVANLLTFARQHHSEKTYLNLNEVVEKVLALRGYSLRTSNIAIEMLLDPDLPPTLADFNQLQQVLLNVIVNAEQAMQEAHGSGSLRLESMVTGGQVVVTITDNGPGIAQAHLNRIFDPFFTTKPQGKGTGLGLSISYGIMQEHGGQIMAESVVGQGTKFTIALPLEADGESMDQPEANTETENVAPLSVLVVDDEAGILRVIERGLVQAGHACDTASTVDEAIALVRARVYDIILSDVRMSGKGGKEFYEEALAIDSELADRFIFMTGDTVTPTTFDFLESLGRNYLVKPFGVDDVVEALRSNQSTGAVRSVKEAGAESLRVA